MQWDEVCSKKYFILKQHFCLVHRMVYKCNFCVLAFYSDNVPQTNFVPSACEIIFARSATAEEVLTYMPVCKKKKPTPQPTRKPTSKKT